MKRLLCFTLLYMLMALPSYAAEFAVVQCLLPTVNAGTVDCTSSGFGTPKGTLIWGTYATANGTQVDHAGFWIGGYDGTRQNSVTFVDGDNLDTSDSGSLADNNSAVATLAAVAQTQDGDCMASFITDGVRLTCGTAPPTGYRVNVLLLGGTNMTSVYVGTGTGSGTQNNSASITSPGFQPDCVIVWANNGNAASLRPSIGFACETATVVTQVASSESSNNASSTMQTAGRITTSRILTNSVGAATVELTDITTTGFDVTTRDAGTALSFGYLAFKMNSLGYKIITSSSPSSPGTDSVTGVGFTPQLALSLIGERAAIDTTYSTDNAENFGLSAVTVAGAANAGLYLEDSDNFSNTESTVHNNMAYLRKDGADFSVCAFSAFTADGMTNSCTTGTTAYVRGMLFVQSSAVSGGGGGGGQMLLGVTR